jgi:3-methyladenine DNA glycosylase Tag
MLRRSASRCASGASDTRRSTRSDEGRHTELGIAYRDNECGTLVHDDRLLFEFLILK